MRIFISSVQTEFEQERANLAEFIAGDAMLSKLFETFLFERDIPASDRQPQQIYLDEVANCDLYLGLFGSEYGRENDDGLSPTHVEFKEATRRAKPRLIYVKGKDDAVERMGTGTGDMIRRCRKAGLPEPEFKLTDGFVTVLRRPAKKDEPGPVRDQVGTKSALSRHQVAILRKSLNPSPLTELMEITGRSDRTKFRHQVLRSLLEDGLLVMTIPDKPTSSKQRYRTTGKGLNALSAIQEKKGLK